MSRRWAEMIPRLGFGSFAGRLSKAQRKLGLSCESMSPNSSAVVPNRRTYHSNRLYSFPKVILIRTFARRLGLVADEEFADGGSGSC